MVNIEDLTFSVYRRHDDGVLEHLNGKDNGTPVPGAVFTDYGVANAYVEEANNKDPGSYHYVCVTGWRVKERLYIMKDKYRKFEDSLAWLHKWEVWMAEPRKCFSEAMEEIERLEKKLEATQQLLAELVDSSFNASCRCGDWELFEQHEKDDIMKRIKALEEDDEEDDE